MKKHQQRAFVRQTTMMNHFYKACQWLELDCNTYYVREFHKKVGEIAGTESVYDVRCLKKLLKEHYEEHIFFTDEPGIDIIICFKNMADFIINRNTKRKKGNIKDETERIIAAAANLIKAEIKEKNYDMNVYPSSTKSGQLNWMII